MGILLPLVLPLCWAIMGLEGLPFPDGDDIVNFTLLPDSVCDRAHQYVVAVATVDADDAAKWDFAFN